jgi:hypothetical protein
MIGTSTATGNKEGVRLGLVPSVTFFNLFLFYHVDVHNYIDKIYLNTITIIVNLEHNIL